MKEYYEDTYAKKIECTVLKVEEKDKTLEVYTDKTLCYPECGGQPGDRGMLGPYEIKDTQKASDGDSVHVLAKGVGIKEGDRLTMELDWSHRHKFMVMHTAQHMLSGLLFNKFNIGTVSVHLGDDYLTIETNQEEIEPQTIDELVNEANDRIAEAHRIVYHEMSHKEAENLGLRRSIKVDGDVRIVEIEGVDRIACGGVHVASTSEIRLILYIGQQKIRDHVRLFFVCGKDALDSVFDNRKTLEALRTQLSCSTYGEIEPKVAKMVAEKTENANLMRMMSERIAETEIEEHLENRISAFESRIGADAFLKAAEKYEEIALCIVNDNSGNGKNWLIVLKGRYQNMEFAQIREKVLMPTGAKGGGRNGVYRGSCEQDIIHVFCELIKSFENV